jgi:nicotinamidase/pyrazinamidase
MKVSMTGRIQEMSDGWGVIVTDVQGDFTVWKDGSLAVPGSDSDYVRSVETATRQLKELGMPIFGTQDWHPANHISFFTTHPGKRPFDVIDVNGRSQILWPPHCVQGTEKARILIDNNLFLAVVRKAQDPLVESYSAFHDDGGVKTEMDGILRLNNVRNLAIYGIATDFCVRATALDGVYAGYRVTVIEELCRGVAADTTASALQEMIGEGVRIVTRAGDLIAELRGS